MAGKLKVLVVSTEAAPLAKVSSAAEVAGSLPKALRAFGVDARIMMPGYRVILKSAEAYSQGEVLPVAGAGGIDHPAEIWIATASGVPVYLVANEDCFGCATDSRRIYQSGPEAWIFFCRAVLEWLQKNAEGWVPDVIHINDWHTSLCAVYLATYPESYRKLAKTAVVCTIHNLAYQGEFDDGVIPYANLPWDVYHYDRLECFGRANFLKGGIVYSDLVNTVSRTYAQEIQTPEYGCRLDRLLRYKDANHRLWGIVSGIDYKDYNPQTDALIARTFSSGDLQARSKNKAKLQRLCGLKVSKATPIFGFTGGAIPQKGIDLMEKILPKMLEVGAQFVFLGTGEPAYEKSLTRFAVENPEQVFVKVGFDAEFARQIYAGVDFFLMPSRLEPCGQEQMIALRYGSVPIARSTGGLADTVSEWIGEAGCGFVFGDYTAFAFWAAVERALAVFKDKAQWEKLVRGAMEQDWSWSRSSKAYIRFYKEAIRVHAGEPARSPA
ncbi:MAG: glycogen synthase [Armatimonadetes bacterium]|nr:glycogen synthase [Armatimonadota bacterium]